MTDAPPVRAARIIIGRGCKHLSQDSKDWHASLGSETAPTVVVKPGGLPFADAIVRIVSTGGESVEVKLVVFDRERLASPERAANLLRGASQRYGSGLVLMLNSACLMAGGRAVNLFETQRKALGLRPALLFHPSRTAEDPAPGVKAAAAECIRRVQSKAIPSRQGVPAGLLAASVGSESDTAALTAMSAAFNGEASGADSVSAARLLAECSSIVAALRRQCQCWLPDGT